MSRVKVTALGGVHCFSDEIELLELPRQRLRCALLVYLAVEQRATREAVQNLFWPDRADEKGRAALKQTVYELRRSLGEDCIVSHRNELAVAGCVDLDFHDFTRAVDDRDWSQASTLYAGPFLKDFSLPHCKPFEFWTDRKRAHVARLHRVARREYIAELLASERTDAALAVARRWVELEPLEDEAQHKLIELLAISGERAEGLRQAENYERLLSDDGLEALEDTKQLVSRLRLGEAITLSNSTMAPNALATPGIAADPLPDASVSRPARAAPAWSIAFGLIVLLFVGFVAALSTRARTAQPVFAVGNLDDHTGLDSLRLSIVIQGLLQSELMRIRGLTVVSESRLRELHAYEGGRSSSSDQLLHRALQAGATDVIEGAIYHVHGDSLRLDLRRVRLDNSIVRGSVTVTGPDAFAVTSQAVEQLAKLMHSDITGTPLGEVGTRSVVAWRLYQEGLHALYVHNPKSAARLFAAALEEDSTFAMAAYQASRIAAWSDDYAGRKEPLRRAVRMLDHVTDRERLLILSEWAEVRNDPAWLAFAETLMVRYPSEPEGGYRLGQALSSYGRFAQARRLLRDAAVRDSAALSGGSRSSWLCRACDALRIAIWVDIAIDSFASAERTARWWLSFDSTSVHARNALAIVLLRTGRTRHALGIEQLIWRDMGIDDSPQFHVERALRFGEFGTADSLLEQRSTDARITTRQEAYWWRTVSLRQQGRLRDAFSSIRQYRALLSERFGDRIALLNTAHEQQVLFELGRYREAIALGDSMLATDPFDRPEYDDEDWEGARARHRAWTMAHVAEAVAALGDTARLKRLTDSLEVIGRASAYGRDRRLHHHARGLMLLARHDTAGALRELRAAIHSVTEGYTRTNYVLGRVLTATGRAREAIAVLEPALRGGLGASNLYVTRTELYEALSAAYVRAGNREKARSALQKVVAAWSAADPPFRARGLRAAWLPSS